MVNKFITAAVIVSTIAMGATAFAAPGMGDNQDSGFITNVDQGDKTLTLSSGATYLLPYGFDINSLNEGQKVAVTWDQFGGSAVAQTVVFTN